MSHACAMSVSPSPLLAPEPRVSRVESVWLTALSPAPSTTWYPVGFRSKEGLYCGGGIPDPGWEFLQHGSPQRILDMAFPPWWPCTFIPEAEGWTRWPLETLGHLTSDIKRCFPSHHDWIGFLLPQNFITIQHGLHGLHL